MQGILELFFFKSISVHFTCFYSLIKKSGLRAPARILINRPHPALYSGCYVVTPLIINA